MAEEIIVKPQNLDDWLSEVAVLKALAEGYRHIDLGFSHSEGTGRTALEEAAAALESYAAALADLLDRSMRLAAESSQRFQQSDAEEAGKINELGG
ncbi:hypothetical protein [Bifidobacterium stellenboschense]|uniref:Uncharacterized protein n=1 Tax=Bifidobacterium stellenboschense TaxID=762211 RepID=A0A087DWW6_9BIFI|nr:hypothetical protein [Bifidobacterium stellenboschense]KFJ00017.1 hypothetical protein BSTEL_1067 [Bifidobacterium stellenboschense]